MAPSNQIKIRDVLDWLFSPQGKFPDIFIEQKNKLNSIVPYITEQFWCMPQVVNYLNKHSNDLYNIPDPLEQLKLIKKIINYQGLTRKNTWFFIPQRTPDYIQEIQNREGYDEGNARSKYLMIQKQNENFEKYKRIAANKQAVKKATQKEDLNLIAKVVQEQSNEFQLQKFKKDDRFIDNLTQETMDEMGLILFDITILKKTNRILFIFIDKNNKKHYWLQPFMAKIYISKKDGVINNDYIEEKDPNKFDEYIITNYKDYQRLKYMLNDSYKKTINRV